MRKSFIDAFENQDFNINMKNVQLIFWNVDTQKDFVEPSGKLYVKDAELLKGKWARITELACQKNIRVVNTADCHFPDASEISVNPDYIITFPPHCLAGTDGSEYIEEVKPDSPFIIGWDKKLNPAELESGISGSRNIVLYKNVFDVFSGNPYTADVLKILNPEKVIVYGVTTNICVDFSVRGLVKYVRELMVVADAIKELPGLPLPFEDWERLGVRMIYTDEIESFINL